MAIEGASGRGSEFWVVLTAFGLAAGCGPGTSPSTTGARQAAGACGDVQLPLTLEAEDAELTGVETSAEVSGFSGSGYVTGFGDSGDRVTFDVCAPEAGYYTVEFGYAKGSEGVATRALLVDGREFAAHPMFPPLWTWSAWEQGGRRAVHLEAGDHRIALALQEQDSGEIRVDSMRFSSGPSPSEISVRSVLMNDWESLVVGWQAGQLYPKDDRDFGPRMAALHWAGDWPTNQIDEAQAFFRDDTAGKAFDDPNQFFTNAYFTADDGEGYGELHVDYGTYGVEATPVRISRRQIVPPREDFVVVLYDLENLTPGARRFSLLEWADLHNKTEGPSEDAADTGQDQEPSGELRASWDDDRSAWIVDLTATNGTVIAMGAFEPVDHHVAGTPENDGPDRGAPTVQAFFEDPAQLVDAGERSDADMGVGLSKTLDLAPGDEEAVAFFYGVAATVEDARALVDTIRSKPVAGWDEQSTSAWKGWLDSGKATAIRPPVAAWGDAFRLAMITIHQAQQPEFGSFVAATNPAYFYSVWPRDAAVTAMGLDAAGYLDQGAKYWSWMAQAQADGSHPDYPQGTWWTNYSYWKTSEGITFVSPEWDSLGLFHVGVYHHYEAARAVDGAGASRFLADVWPAVERAADFIANGVGAENHGFGPPDFSIWEENLAYHTFTQVTYVAGLRAAARLAETLASTEQADRWSSAAETIRDAIFRDVSAEPCPGLWEGELRYFIRSVLPDCSPNRTIDAASDLLWVFGVLDPEDPRATQHRDAILANLTQGEWGHGISRYEGDTFYYSAEFSPGGAFEAEAEMPTWPQMAMYMTMLEHWLGMDEIASNRLSWYASTAPWGYMPHGEAVDWSTQRPLISTASEPVTGAWFGLALLNQLGEFDPRVPRRSDGGGGGASGSRR